MIKEFIHQNKPEFENIFGIYVIPPGFRGVVRRLGKIISVENPGFITGIPLIHDVALVPETPGVIENLEDKVRSSDNRLVTIKSTTNIIINDPETYIRRAPDNYLERVDPKISNLVQQTTGQQYSASEVIANKNALCAFILKELNDELQKVRWGLEAQAFWYTASIDPADLLFGEAEKLRKAELEDAAARRKVAMTEADAKAKVEYILKKYEIDIDVYGLIREGEALAAARKQVGLADVEVEKQRGLANVAVLHERLETYDEYIGKVLNRIASVREKITDKDEREDMIFYILSPLKCMLGIQHQPGEAPLDTVTEAFRERIKSRLDGQGLGRYVDALSGSGVNPTIAFAGRVAPDIVNGFKREGEKQKQ